VHYAFLIYETPQDFAARAGDQTTPYVAAWRAYYRTLVDAGAYVGGEPLQPAGTAATVRHRDGDRHVQDGPYAEAKEQLGGFMVVDFPSLDAALEWAARCPAAATGAVEVRPLAPDVHQRIVS
jgi:hypothetical protein